MLEAHFACMAPDRLVGTGKSQLAQAMLIEGRWKMSIALVLGGQTGLLGQALCPALEANGFSVHTLGRNDGNIFDPAFLEKQIKNLVPDVVFNTIAWTQVDDAEDHREEADEVNRVFPLILARILKTLPNAWLGHFSTDFVFSEPATRAWKETDTPAPASVYGQTKLAGEKAVMGELPQRSCIIRTAWLFGSGKKNFVSTILNLAQQKDSLSVVDDQNGSPTYTTDLAEWSMALAKARATGIWHAVNSGMASWYELAREACQLMGYACKLQPVPSSAWPQKAARPSFSVLDNKKLADFLGTQPRPWPQALREYIFSDCVADDGETKK